MIRSASLSLASAGIATLALVRASDSDAGTAGASTQAIVIQSYDFTIPAPYAEGHALNANEAAALNQLYAENVRNNSASRIKAAREAVEKEGGEFSLDTYMVGEGDAAVTLRQSIEDYAANYEFGARRTSTREPVDPIQREAQRIAKELVSQQLGAKGIKIKDLADGVYDQHVAAVAANERVQKLATKRVKEREELAKAGDFDLGDLETKEPEAETTEG
jgi:hypothetical protein